MLLILVVLPSGILSARTFFWVSTLAVAHLLKWDTPTRSNDVRELDAADALFATVRTEVEDHPDDWRRWYRLARAYDYAGDRRRAREAMKTAAQLQARS